ncbi:hypothetical protein QVD17_35757 [Tagetes erecta]|uniref:Uncharacterized protein n=1 Tax=Tagetes erecta TaxID=13708 RepID=A0AAD8NHH9_TARER|nr:hypothetical protein QVD17_35757 [Tagetes erecta]
MAVSGMVYAALRPMRDAKGCVEYEARCAPPQSPLFIKFNNTFKTILKNHKTFYTFLQNIFPNPFLQLFSYISLSYYSHQLLEATFVKEF